MWAVGFTINMMTLMALSLVIGILIDDAVVVRENIYRHMEHGEDPMTAARNGSVAAVHPAFAAGNVLLSLREIDARIPRSHLAKRAVPTSWAAKGTVMRAVMEAARMMQGTSTNGHAKSNGKA